MTVPITLAPTSGTETSGKLLNSNDNIGSVNNGISFNATMNQTASNYNFDDQRYILSDGQILTAEQLLEMLETGNSLPDMSLPDTNLPSLAQLQQYKLHENLNNQKFQPGSFTGPLEKTVVMSDRFIQLDPTTNLMNNKLVVTSQQFMNQPFSQSQILKPGAAGQEQFLVAFTAMQNTSSNNPELSANGSMTANGFTAEYGMQMASGVQGTTGVISNSFSINTPVQHPQWNQSVGQSIQWMVNNNMQQIEIKLNPPDLGLLDIRLSMNSDQATVSFVAPNSAVREALESAMPRLKEMLEESGISLADVNVSEHSLEQGHEQTESDKINKSHQEMSGGEQDDASDTPMNSVSSSMKIGLLDTYA